MNIYLFCFIVLFSLFFLCQETLKEKKVFNCVVIVM
nr:MAG TPA: hypothetical protein [Caudoviricetes sp.]